MNSEMEKSDDDLSFEMINSDDLHTDKSDQTDDDSFEFLGSEELDPRIKDMDEVAFADNIPDVNEMEQSEAETAETMDKAQLLEKQPWDDTDSYSDESTNSAANSQFFDIPYMIPEKYGLVDNEMFLNKTVTYRKADGTILHNFPANIKLKEDMEIKDVVKDHVLPFLPAKSLARFRSVSRDWDQWIGNPFLAHRQSCYFRNMSGFFCQHQYDNNHFFVALDWSAYGVPYPSLEFLPEKVRIMSSCNGLLLCQGGNDENVYYICNPANGDFHVLPSSIYYHGQEPSMVLVFEPSLLNFEADYQVICAFDSYDGPPMLSFDVYSSKTWSWICSTSVCAEIGNSTLKNNGFYMNGVVYWETSSGELMAFDVKNDLCGVQPIPREREAEGILTLIDGEISYIQSYTGTADEKAGTIEIFGGVDMHLKRRIAVDLDFRMGGDVQGFNVLLCMNNNILICWIRGGLYSYDIIHGTFKVISRRISSIRGSYVPYVNSLVRLPYTDSSNP